MRDWIKDIQEDETTRTTDKTIIKGGKNTEQRFNKLIELNLEKRLVGPYSYDVVDNPEYEHCNKMERKIQHFEKKAEKKRKSAELSHSMSDPQSAQTNGVGKQSSYNSEVSGPRSKKN